MSTTIDERVVEMRFDNQNFEHNAARTMSTLERLKQKLNLTGASKGLENINTAAKNVNMNGLGSAVDTVTAKFSALQVMGTTALVRITNQAMATGERMIKALTIDPVKTGFQEYETQINAVQTILANTESKGSTIDDVNNALEELNKYADKTIYNFTEMTRNIGTFTAAGVDLDTSVNAIQGIANLAAVSGSTSQQASTAMYQLSQALAAGTVKLMDWNSVVNAGMGGQVFQDALKETARAHGIAIDDMIAKQGSFRETLSEGWITSEILTETLQKFTLTTEGLTDEQIKANREMLRAKGYTDDQIDGIFKLGNTATNAATKVKTFTQLWDVMKESAQSGWSQTWKIIVGDFEEAKELLTPLSDFFNNIINTFSKARNDVLESALGNRFKQIGETIKGITKPIENSAESIKGVVKSVEEYATVVDDIIGGKWGTGQERWDKLAEAGYDWAHAQNLVNEKLGSSVRHATDYKEAQNGVAKSQEKTNQSTAEYIASLTELSDAELKNLNLQPDQIKALRELEKQSEKTGIPVKDLVEDIDLLNGRTLLINSFKNAGTGILEVFRAIKEAWQDIFPPKSTEEKAQKLYDLIAALHKFTTYLTITDESGTHFNETGKKIIRIFKGIFAVVDLVTTILGGGFKIAFKLVSAVLKYFGMDALELLAVIGDVLVGFRNWVDALLNFDGIVSKVMPLIIDGAKAIKGWGEAFLELPSVQNVIQSIRDALSSLSKIDLSNISLSGIFDSIKGVLDTLKGDDYSSIGEFIWDGLIIGLGKGVVKAIQTIGDCASQLIDKFKEVLGIHSPSKVFIAIGGFIISGLILGIKEGVIKVPEAMREVIEAGIEAIKNIDFGKVMTIAFGAGILAFVHKLGNALVNFSEPFAAVSDILENTAEVVKKVGKSFAKLTKAIAFNQNMKGIKNLAISIAILAGALLVVAYFGKDNWSDMVKAAGMISWMALILVGLAVSMNLLSKASIDISKNGIKMDGMTGSLLAIAAAIGILGLTVKLLSTIKWPQALGAFVGLTVLMGLLIGFVALAGKVGDYKSAAVITKLGGMLIKLSIALILMVVVCKLVGKLEAGEMIKGGLFVTAFLIFIGTLAKVTKNGTNLGGIGGMMIKLAIGLMLMVLVCKLVSKLEPTEAIAGVAFALAFGLFIKSLIKAAKMGEGNQIAKLGGLLLSVSFAMILMVAVCKLVGKLSPDEIVKGAVFVAGFLLVVWALTSMTKITNEQQTAKIAGTLFAFAGAIAILALVAALLSLMDTADLIKGLAAVTVLGLLMIGLVKSLKGAQNVAKSIMWMAIGIAILAAAIGILSFIDPKKLVGPTIAMGILMGMFALMIKALGALKGVNKTLVPLITLTVIVGILAFIVWKLSELETRTALTNTGALAMLMGAFAASMFIMGKAGNISKSVTKTMLPMLGVVLGLAAILSVMSLLKVNASLSNVLGLSVLMLAFSASIAILGAAGEISKSVMKTMLPMFGVVAGLAAILTIMSLLKVDASLSNVLGLSILMLAFSASMVILSAVGHISTSVNKMMLPMLGVVAGLAIILGILTWLDVAPSIETVAGLSVMLLSFSAAILILSYVGPGILLATTAIKAMGILVAGLTVVLAALGGLSKIPGFNDLIRDGGETLSLIGYALGNFVGSLVGGLAAGITSGLPEIGRNLSDFMTEVTPFVEGAKNIDESALAGVKNLMEVLLGIGITSVGTSIADIWTDALGDQSAIEKFKTDGVAFFQALKEIALEAKGAALPEDFSVDGVKTLITAIASVGAISVGTSLADVFTNYIGDQSAMEKFKADGKAFFAAIKEISTEMVGFSFPEDFSVEGLETLLKALKSVGNSMIGLSFADLFATGDQTAMEKFKTDGKAFFSAIKEISTEMVGFSFPEDFSVKGLETLLKALKSVGNSMIGLSIADLFAVDGTAMDKFKTDGKAFFAAVKAISTEMVGFSFPEDFSVDGLNKLFEVFKSVGSYTKSSTWSDIFTLGGTSMEKFETDGKAFFGAIKTISTESAGITIAGISTAENAVNLIKKIIESTKGIDYSGVEKFTGIGTGGFGADGPMHDIGKAIKDFSEQVADIDTSAVNTSVTAAIKIRSLINSLVNLDTSGIKNFKVESIGTAMKAYNDQVKNVDTAVISSSISSAKKLVSLINSLVEMDPSGISKFRVKPIGTAMHEYSGQVGDINPSAISASINSARKMVSLINSMAGIDASGVSTFKTAISDLSSVSFKGVEEAFNGASTKLVSSGVKLIDSIAKGMKSRQGSLLSATGNITNAMLKAVNAKMPAFATAGRNIMGRLITGINTQKAKAGSAVTSALTSAIASARNKYTSFYSAGSFLVDGFASGISANSYKASAKAAAMAEAAYKAAKEALKINSPSKIFRALAYSVPEGFAMGIDKGSDMVQNSAVSMSNTAINSVRDSISRMYSVVNGEVDLQPTIRPVLDLSDVRSGAGNIASIFGNGVSIGASANLNSVSARMAARGQNGGNADVVSAIDKLRKGLGNVGGTTYNVNGVTYDDGSNIAGAVETIARAALRERRT